MATLITCRALVRKLERNFVACARSKMTVVSGARFAHSACALAYRAETSGSSRDRLTRLPQEHHHSAAGMRGRLPPARHSLHYLALQLPFLKASESMGNHDSAIVDAGSVD
jgi:hypothetical protein